MELTSFEKSYIETMLWSSTDMDNADRPFDDGYYADTKFAEKTLAQIRKDCANFAVACAGILDVNTSEYHVAHDFWLTRNGHGAGFWDGDYPEPMATQLTDLAHSFGEQHLYIGDDGKFYLFRG